MQTTKVRRRRLDEEEELSEDETPVSDDNEDDRELSEQGEGDASLDDRTVIEESMAQLEEEISGDDHLAVDGGEEARTLPKRGEQREWPVDTRAAEDDVPSQAEETRRGEGLRYDNGDHAGEDESKRMSKHAQYLKEKELQEIIENAQKQLKALSKERSVKSGKDKDISLIPSTALGRPHPSSNQKRSEVANEFAAAQTVSHSRNELYEKLPPSDEVVKPWLKPDQKWKHEYSDAHKNTMKAFLDKDREAGVKEGYHFAKVSCEHYTE